MYIIINTTFVLNVILFPPGDLAKGSFFLVGTVIWEGYTGYI